MTIFNPDDSEVSEIVLPDGSQASEMVAPDGSVVWTAGGDIPDSVDHQWPVDEGSGTELINSIGNVDVTLIGGAWQSDAQTAGDYVSLDGSDDEITTDSTINANAETGTVMGWVRPVTNNFSKICTPDLWGDENGWDISWMGDSTLRVYDHKAGSFSSAVTGINFVPTDSWGFFALIFDGNTYRVITFDRSQEITDDQSTGANYRTFSDKKLVVGRGEDNNFEGGVSDILFAENTAMSKSDITTVWENTR